MKKEEKWHPLDVVVKIASFVFKLFSEIIFGAVSGKLPWVELLAFGLAANALIFFKADYYLMKRAFNWYPTGLGYLSYWIFASFGPFFAWSFWQQVRRPAIQKFLKSGFDNAGLKNGSGDYPKFISDEEVDDVTRCMRFAHNGVTFETFKSPTAISKLEHQWGISIDEVTRKEDHPLEVQILYGYGKKDTGRFDLTDTEKYLDYSFPFGKVRGLTKTSNFDEISHLLVAGSTNGGKSTFIRSLVTVIHQSNLDAKIKLFDLKGELDAQVFEKADRISVFGKIDRSLVELVNIDHQLDKRMSLFKEAGVQNINAYNKFLAKKSKQPLYEGPQKCGRIIVIIDECSEILQKNSNVSLQDVETAKRVVNRVARLGRALGIHLVLGVQYPTKQSLETTVKTNLPAVLCFYMANTTGSVVALGNVKANQLSSDKAGVAIWQYKNKQYEVIAPIIEFPKVAEIMSYKGKIRGNEDGLYEVKNKPVEEGVSTASGGSEGPEKSVEMENHDDYGVDKNILQDGV